MTQYDRIGIVGSGRVAQALAVGLAPHSKTPPLLWGRSADKTAVAAARVGAVATPNIERIVGDCDVIGVAVADDALAAVVAAIGAAMPVDHGLFAFHVSGRSGAAILEPIQSQGALTAAVHPAMTFTGDPHAEVRRMAQARFAVTGSSPAATERARDIVARLNGVAVDIAEDRRPLYHAGLCHASNHLVTLMAGASHALTAAGIANPAAMLAPLVRAALENSLDRGFEALSGPVLRGDEQTVTGHLSALATHCPDLLPAYRALALATLDELGRTESSALRRALDSTADVP